MKSDSCILNTERTIYCASMDFSSVITLEFIN